MPTYKLLNDAFIGGTIYKTGNVVDMKEEDAKGYLERGTLGASDAVIDTRNSFQKTADESDVRAAELAKAGPTTPEQDATTEATTETVPLAPATGQPTQEQIDKALEVAQDSSTASPAL
jgi:hypothetical protein